MKSRTDGPGADCRMIYGIGTSISCASDRVAESVYEPLSVTGSSERILMPEELDGCFGGSKRPVSAFSTMRFAGKEAIVKGHGHRLFRTACGFATPARRS